MNDPITALIYITLAMTCASIGFAFRATLDRPRRDQAFRDGKELGIRETEDRFMDPHTSVTVTPGPIPSGYRGPAQLRARASSIKDMPATH